MSQLGFADLGMVAGNARRDRLGRIEQAIDWAPVAALLSGLRQPGGRPPYEALAMFRALLLAQWHDLSDPALEDALADRASFRRFCGFSLDARTPDETTLCRFRNALKEARLGAALFEEVARQLDERGYVLRKGTIIDATLIESAVRPPASGSTPKGIEAARHSIKTPTGRAAARGGGCSSATRPMWRSTRAPG
jgi:transposase, IS5 family